ncbi:MAG: hypothetical protein KA247_07805 [Bacteroidetes bacterium]|nr:hypothetical protein [Bacteroidota bacterium]
MKNILLLIVVMAAAAVSQPLTKEKIRSSNTFYYGEATSELEQEASDHALKNLVQSIAVNISSQMTRVVSEKNGNLQDTYENVVNSYSNATLKDVKFIKQPVANGIEVFAYMEKSEVTKMFQERKKLVTDIYEKALEFEADVDIANALKYYYFSIILMNSIPDKAVEYQTKNLLIEIPLRINALINNTKFKLVADKRISDKERELQFEIMSFGKPIRKLDFSCWDGVSQVNVSAVDGAGIFRLIGASASFDKIDLAIKYQYYESREEIKEVADLWGFVNKPSFKNAQNVPLAVSKPTPAPVPVSIAPVEQLPPSTISAGPVVKQSGVKFSVELNDREKSPKAVQIASNTAKFLDMIDKRSAEQVKKEYANDPFLYEKVTSLLKYNNPIPIDQTAKADLNKTATGWEVRKIRVLTSYPSLNRQATEYLILDFDHDGNFYDINFGTVEQLYDQFVEQGSFGNDWGNRQTIVKFIEKYRSAFLTRNMAMLDSMFAEEAVIIVGRELKKGKKSDNYQYSKMTESQPDIQYVQYTKKQYLDNQKKAFKNQKDIFLGYSTFKINKKNNMPGTYGISMKQFYAATTYADEGHLFLLVDFLQDQPQIYVRSWQPHEWNEDAMIKLANFKLNK